MDRIEKEKCVVVIIVAYNGMRWLPKCIETLYVCEGVLNVILVDNCSTDNTEAYIRNEFPDICYLKTEANIGFGRANNLGIKYAIEQQADFIFLLNQDVYLKGDVIFNLIKKAESNKLYGILSPEQLDGTGQSYDHNFFSCVRKHQSNKDYSPPSTECSTKILEVDFVMAAMWLIPMPVIKIVGGFDPIFSHYGEDDDYVNRIHYHGFKLGICRGQVGLHDRQYRVHTTEKDLHISYVRYLSILKNINQSATYSKFYAVCLGTYKSLQFLLAGNFSQSFENLGLLKKAFSLWPLVNSSRRISSIKQMSYIA